MRSQRIINLNFDHIPVAGGIHVVIMESSRLWLNLEASEENILALTYISSEFQSIALFRLLSLLWSDSEQNLDLYQRTILED